MPRALREQLILDVAGDVFAQRGYHEGSMDEIAERAEVSKPILYTYFGSKEGLYLAYIERHGRELVDRLVAAGLEEDRPDARPQAPISEFLRFVEEHRAGWIVLFREAASSAPIAQEVAGLRTQIIEAVRAMLDRETAGNRRLPPAATEALAHAIVGAGESLANWWLEHPDVRREEVASWYVGLVQASVRATLPR
jgi:AcrR family transcriptional regulator